MAGLPHDRSTEPYYEQRSAEYDDWYLGGGLFAERDRPGWDEDVRALIETVASLPPARTVDVACGTGFLTQHLRGRLVGIDASAGMLTESRQRHAHPLVRGDAFALPFRDRSFERAFTGHFYGHLLPEQRARFLAESRRVAPELVVVDAKIHPDVRSEQMQKRVLNDGSSHRVFKRYFTAAQLADELGGGPVLFDGRWFVMVSSGR
jgi:demethylmenaquinone methyltransferase/2-methoxy-6-polyprenyl-1,4-benzoquinol methylase